MVSQEKFEQLADELMEKQGFIIIGFPAGVQGYAVGHVTDRIMQFVMPAKYEVFAKAKQSDWSKQNDLIQTLRPEWQRFPNVNGGDFRKLKPLLPCAVLKKADQMDKVTETREPEKCVFVGCENIGVPQDGFDFFMCSDCSDELEEALEDEGKRVYARHENN